MLASKQSLNWLGELLDANVATLGKEIQFHHDIAMSAAAAASRRADALTPQVDALKSQIDALAFATDAGFAASDRNEYALRAEIAGHVERFDKVIRMLMEYLDVEIVHEPERVTTIEEDGFLSDIISEPAKDYIAKRGKKRR